MRHTAVVLEATPTISLKKLSLEVKFTERKSALQQKEKVRNRILPFITTYHPALLNLKKHLDEQMALVLFKTNHCFEKYSKSVHPSHTKKENI